MNTGERLLNLDFCFKVQPEREKTVTVYFQKTKRTSRSAHHITYFQSLTEKELTVFDAVPC